MKSNLEPIEESDLDLEGKLKQGDVEAPLSKQELPLTAKVEQILPQEITQAEKDDSYGKILAKVQTQTDDIDQAVVADDAKVGVQMIDAESQVNHLIDIASQKGIVHAVKVAQHMQDNYTLDTFHDKMLADELHNALLAKGMITEL